MKRVSYSIRRLNVLFPVIVLAVPASGFAQQAEIGVYHQTTVTRVTDRRTVASSDYLQGYAYLSARLGIWGFALHETGYSSITAGLYFDFTDWLEVGVAGGAEFVAAETARQTNSRWATILRLGSDDRYLESYYENGASRSGWYQVDAMWQVGPLLGLGILSQRYSGTGPRVLVRPFGKPTFELWVVPLMYDAEMHHVNAMAGFQLRLQKDDKGK